MVMAFSILGILMFESYTDLLVVVKTLFTALSAKAFLNINKLALFQNSVLKVLQACTHCYVHKLL